MAKPTVRTSGANRIATQRTRQLSPDASVCMDGDLARAAACYAVASHQEHELLPAHAVISWPWASEYWEPSPGNPIRDLEKAAILIAAEIDRLLAKETDA